MHMEQMIEQLEKHGVNPDLPESAVEFPPRHLSWCDDSCETCVELAVARDDESLEVLVYCVPHAEGIVRRTLHLVICISETETQCIASPALHATLDEVDRRTSRFNEDAGGYDISFAAAQHLLDGILPARDVLQAL